MIESPIDRDDVKIVATVKQYVKWSSRPNFKKEKQFCNKTTASEKEKCRINPNKSIYIETSILHLSEVLMQVFRYNDSKGNVALNLECSEQIMIIWCIKLKLKVFMMIFIKVGSYFSSVLTQKVQNNAIELVIDKMREEIYGGFMKGFVGLKRKILS